MQSYQKSEELDVPSGAPIDASAWFSRVLRYVSHGKLMLICLAIGLLVGLIYFTFGRPTYYSRSLMRVTLLSLPVHNDSASNDANALGGMVALRAFRLHLLSDYIQSRVAQKLGVATAKDSPETIREFVIPRVDIDFIDADHLEVSVYSYNPSVVRDYAQTLISEFSAMEKESRDIYRTTALETYVKELDQYHAKIDEHLKERMDFEASTSLAQVFIQQNSLTQVPKDIVLTKDRLGKMEAVRVRLLAHGDELDVVTKLSLLTGVRKELPIEVGSVVRNLTGTIQSVQPQAKSTADVIISPSMVENPEAWQLLEKRQRELQEEQTRAAAIYQPGHSAMIKITAEIGEVKDKLKAELDVALQRFDLEYAQQKDKLTALEAKLPEYNSVTAKYEKFRQDYMLLEKGQLDWNKAASEIALSIAKLQFGADKERIQAEFAGTMSLRDVDPVSPNKSKLALIAAGLGLFLAIGLPSVLMLWDTSVHRLQDIEEKSGVRGIGLIPLASPEFLEDIFRSPKLDANVPNFLLEAHRMIRSNIALRPNSENRSQVILVTSARPTEGKSTLASNLAWAEGATSGL
jgi:polysaccharide biosynthesis transport protein